MERFPPSEPTHFPGEAVAGLPLGGQHVFLPAPIPCGVTAGVTGLNCLLRKTEDLLLNPTLSVFTFTLMILGGYILAGAAKSTDAAPHLAGIHKVESSRLPKSKVFLNSDPISRQELLCHGVQKTTNKQT